MSGAAQQTAARSFANADEIDFSSSAGLQQLLSVVRTTPLSRSTYNELRDLIFSYKHSNDDPSARTLIVNKLAEAGVLPASSATEVTPAVPEVDPAVNQVPIKIASDTASPTDNPPAPAAKPDTSFTPKSVRAGNIRPQPQFGKVTPVTTPNAKAEPVAAVPTPETKPAEPVPTAAVIEESATQPSSPLEVPTEAPAPTTESKSSATSATAVTPSTTVPTEEAVPSIVSPTNDNPEERIKTIKREVNALVGNPVNLIDADNTIGREYMNALLDAMKKLNGANAGELTTAMTRLETAYQAVKEMSPKLAQVAEPKEKPQESVAAPVSPVSTPIPSEPAVPEVGLPKSRLFDKPEPAEPVPLQSAATEAVVSEIPKAEPVVTAFTPVAATPDAPQNAPAPAPVVSATPAPVSAFQSVAETKATQENELNTTIAEARAATAEEEARLSAMDPVMVPAVTQGLVQLLSEWALFKSSGLFGTGPSGAEHPLYKKLAPLQMSAIVAGRFEGATPEIRQSISDYMNGWRYEEGILHQHGETFEHYLRRVIKKIIDRKAQAIADGA